MTVKELEKQYQQLSLDNVGEFIWTVRSAYINKDIPYLILQNFLFRIVDGFAPEGDGICAHAGALSPEDEAKLVIHGKILAALLIILIEKRSYNEAGKKMLLFLKYAACCTKGHNDLIIPALRCLSSNCIEVLYTWEHIRDLDTLELITYQMARTSRFAAEALPPLAVHDSGHLSLCGGALDVSSSLVGSTGAKAWEICNGMVRVYTRNSRDEKLKASDVDDVTKLDDFARVFQLSQADEAKAACGIHYQEVKLGQSCVVEFTGYDDDNEYDHMTASAVNTKEPTNGHILSEELIKGTYTEDLENYFFENDCIAGAVPVMVEGSLCFSIKDCYARYAKQTANADYRESKVFEAIVLEVRDDIGRINWMTARGYGAISRPIDNVNVGDKMVMTIQNIQTRNSDFYINIQQPRGGYDSVDYLFDEDSVLSGFLISKTAAVEMTSGPARSSSSADKNNELFANLAYIMSRSIADVTPIERYKRLLTAGFIYNCIGDKDGYSTVVRECAFLSQLLRFAQGGAVTAASDMQEGSEQRRILECLSTFGVGDKRALAASFISNDEDDLCSQMASVILALDASDQFEDEVKVIPDDARMRLCTLLGVQSHFSAGYVSRVGKYGRCETQNLEFKASYVFRNDTRGFPVADLDYQGRGQVFEAVCAFLNTDEGGTIYIGVDNNTGNPITAKDSGVNGDMDWLCKNYGTVNNMRSRQLGHSVIKPDTLDKYALFLNSEKELYFKKSLHNNIIIEPTEDEDAIRISVKPAQYEIAYLYHDNSFSKGVAYTRNGGRSIYMTIEAMKKRLMSLKQLSKEVQFIVTLNEAIDKKHKVIFRGYHSGNSGQVRDRLVVPINLFYNDENVLCYDLEAKAEKQFRLSRITSIDTNVEDPEYTHCFEPKSADVFRWIGEDNYHIKLRMEVGALNYLLEEYSNAKNLPSEELYQDTDGTWVLDTILHGLGGVRRFYIGLADKITILPTEDSEALKKDIRDFLENNSLKGL